MKQVIFGVAIILIGLSIMFIGAYLYLAQQAHADSWNNETGAHCISDGSGSAWNIETGASCSSDPATGDGYDYETGAFCSGAGPSDDYLEQQQAQQARQTEADAAWERSLEY